MEVVGTARVPTRCAWTLQRASQLCVASVRCGTPGVAATRRQPPPHVGWAAARPPFEAQRRRALSGVLSDEPDEPDELCTFFSRYTVRSWCEEDGLGIDRLVRRVQEVGAGGGTVINPEGVYTEDCLSARQTYTNEGGAFLVVVDTTGLLLGTEVSYFDGGESMADPDRPCVAAVRRLVVDCKRVPEVSVQDGLQAFLLGILETLAAHAAAELMMAANVDLIALGCGPASEELARPRGQLLTTALQSSGFVPTQRLKFPLGPYVYTEMEKRVPVAAAAEQAAQAADGQQGRQGQSKGDGELLEVISTTGTRMGVFPRAFVEQHNLLHRAVGLLVCNDSGEVYVHRRAPTKSVHPSMYDMFVGGLVLAGEGLETAARNEVKEELGIEIAAGVASIEYMFDHDFMGERNRVVVSCYRVTVQQTDCVRYNDGEVVWGQWMPVPELIAMLREESFVPGGLAMWVETLRRGLVT